MKCKITFSGSDVAINGKPLQEEIDNEVQRTALKNGITDAEKIKQITEVLLKTFENKRQAEKAILEAILAAAAKETKLSDLCVIMDMLEEMRGVTDTWIVDERDFQYFEKGWEKATKQDIWFKASEILKQISRPVKIEEETKK